MPRRISILFALCSLICLSSMMTVSAGNKPAGQVGSLDASNVITLRAKPTLTTADTCMVRHDQGIVWKIDGWVAGNELYKGYCDPAATCGSGAYPYTVVEINMPMYFFGATDLVLSVDVEEVDLTNPFCPVPGALLTASAEYTFNIPGTGLYDIWVPLDEPFVVNGPFFAGVFIGNMLDVADSPAVVIDSFPVQCTSYNIWDTNIGFIDLTNNSYWNFPGRLVLYASGVTGSASSDPVTCHTPSDTIIHMCTLSQVGLPVTGTNGSGTQVPCALLTAAGTLTGGVWYYTPPGPEVVTVGVRCDGDDGEFCTDSFQVTFVMNNAPQCTVPADTTIQQDSPQQVSLPVGAYDSDGNLADCDIQSGPGTLVDDHWQYTPSGSEIVTVAIECADLCDTTCVDEFTVTFDVTPVVPNVVTIINPRNYDTLFGNTQIRAWAGADLSAFESAVFEYFNGSGFHSFGLDTEGSSTLRNGVSTSYGDGFSTVWNFSSLAEGPYSVRCLLYKTSGGYVADTIQVYIEPTPPVASIIAPINGDNICEPFTLLMSSTDENLSYVEIHRKPAAAMYSAGIQTLNQSSLGDANGNPYDGNHAANGEFGDFYNAPAAAALAIKLWADRGYSGLMSVGGPPLTLEQLAEQLAAAFSTRDNLGTYDEDLIKGLHSYFASESYINIGIQSNPNYFQLRTLVEEQEQAVLIGLGGDPSVWLTVDGFTGWEQTDGSYMITVSNPLTGTKQYLSMRNLAPTSRILLDGSWHDIDLAVTMTVDGWTASRDMMGADIDGSDGWSFYCDTAGLSDGTSYFYRTVGVDASGMRGESTCLVMLNCNETYVAGDLNGDDVADVLDLIWLKSYVADGGDPPPGGAGRADTNCDDHVNIADVVYLMNYLFGTVGPPCR